MWINVVTVNAFNKVNLNEAAVERWRRRQSGVKRFSCQLLTDQKKGTKFAPPPPPQLSRLPAFFFCENPFVPSYCAAARRGAGGGGRRPRPVPMATAEMKILAVRGLSFS